MRELEAAKQLRMKEKENDHAAITRQIEAFQAQQAQLLEKQKDHHRHLKSEREAQVISISFWMKATADENVNCVAHLLALDSCAFLMVFCKTL